MTGQRGADRDLRRLEVAGLTDEDDVGVLAQEGAQRRREGPAHAVVDLHLVDALQVVLDGILGRHDVVLGRIDRVDGRIERGRLARARRPRDEDHAVRLVDRPGELLQAPLVEAELREVELQRVLVEDPEDRLLAEDRRQGRHAKVDLAGAVPELEAPVLRHAALGDVQVRHDLEAREDRGLETFGRREHLVEHAVDPEPDPEHLLVRLEVYVRGAFLDRVHEHHVDELDDRRLVGRLLQLEGVDLGAVLVALHDLDVGEVRRHVLHDAGDRLGFRLVVTVDRLLDRRLRGDERQHLEVRHEGDVVQREHVGRVGHRERERVPHPPDRQHLVLLRDRRRDELQDLQIDLELREGDGRHAILAREEADQLLLVDEPEPDQDGAELLGRALLLDQSLLELLLTEQTVGDEEVPEPPVDRLTELYLLRHRSLLLYRT